MSWVRNAIENIQSQDYEILHQTVFGGYGTKPNIFWAVDPKDMPDTLRSNVEETVKDDTSGVNNCAIIRLETLPAYKDEELQATGNPVACFSVYVGTNGSNVEFTRQINVYGDRKLVTPQDGQSPSQMWGEIEGNAVSRRLKRMSVSMGWMEPPPLVRRESTAAAAGGRSYRAASVVQKHMSHAGPYQQYRNDAATQRMTRKFSLRPGWIESQTPVKEGPEGRKIAVAAALASLEGSDTPPTSPTKLPDLVPSSTGSTTSQYLQEPASPGPFDMPTPRTETGLSKSDKLVAFHEQVLEEQGADHSEIHHSIHHESPGMSSHHESLVEPDSFPVSSTDTHMSESTGFTTPRETTTTNFPSGPRQADSAQPNEALANLEGNPSRQEASDPEIRQVALRSLKRMPAKRVSLFLEENIPEVESPSLAAAGEASQTPPKSTSRKASVVYAMAALEKPTPVQPQGGQAKAARSRKAMSMYAEPRTGHMAMGAASHMPEQRSIFDTDSPETDLEESTSRKLKRMSWNVIGRALPQLRQSESPDIREHVAPAKRAASTSRKANRASWMPAAKTIPDGPFTQAERMPATAARNEPTLDSQTQRFAEPVARKSNKTFRSSMEPSAASMQRSPRKGHDPWVPWVEPITAPSHAIEPHGNISTLPLRQQRNSWHPKPRQSLAEVPGSPLRLEMASAAHASPAVPSIHEEPAQRSANVGQARKKNNRLSKFVISQTQSPGKVPVETSPDLDRPVKPDSPSTPLQALPMSRMKKFGSKLGNMFHV